MNADRKEFDLIHQKIDTIKADIEKMNKDINNAISVTMRLSNSSKKVYSIHTKGYGRNKIKYNIQTRYEEMENNDYISVSRCFGQVVYDILG